MRNELKSTGFTLIELSIVLVIIGLIVGGILTGWDLINVAAIRAQLSQIEKYNTAVRTFQGKYGGLPGDLTLSNASSFGFNVSGCGGSIGQRDGNGTIDGYYSGGPEYMLEYGEALLFWADLGQAGLIDGTFPNGGGSFSNCGIPQANLTLVGGSAYIGNFFPAAKIGNGNFIYIYDSDPNYGGIDHQNWFGIAAINTVYTSGGMMSAPALSVTQAYNMDKKVDDGLPATGRILALCLSDWWIYPTNSQASDSATSCYNNNTNAYSTDISQGGGLNCPLSFKLQ